jgi:hypothetical protein
LRSGTPYSQMGKTSATPKINKAGAIDRLMKGEVPAAVLALASREAAEWFPDIEGFKDYSDPARAEGAALASGPGRP